MHSLQTCYLTISEYFQYVLHLRISFHLLGSWKPITACRPIIVTLMVWKINLLAITAAYPNQSRQTFVCIIRSMGCNVQESLGVIGLVPATRSVWMTFTTKVFLSGKPGITLSTLQWPIFTKLVHSVNQCIFEMCWQGFWKFFQQFRGHLPPPKKKSPSCRMSNYLVTSAYSQWWHIVEQ